MYCIFGLHTTHTRTTSADLLLQTTSDVRNIRNKIPRISVQGERTYKPFATRNHKTTQNIMKKKTTEVSNVKLLNVTLTFNVSWSTISTCVEVIPNITSTNLHCILRQNK